VSVNPMDLTGRTIVVTGAAQGIGRAIATLCHDLGASVALVDRNSEILDATAGEFASGRVLPMAGDITDEDFARDCVERATGQFGAIHGLVNNAGITRPALLEKMARSDWEAVLGVNLTGCFVMTQAVGRHMVARARASRPEPAGTTGSIVNISSTGAKRGAFGQANYSSAKAGLFGLTMTTALEWAKHGIRCNSVGFGTVVTAMTEVLRSEKFAAQTLARIPLGRYAEPEEAATLVAFLLSNAAVYITGENMTVSGGLHMQP